jgi:predicted metal-binding membrane protein
MHMDAGSLDMMMASEPRRWTMTEFVVMFSIWVVMMVGMLTPSAAPMILLYARVGRQSEMQGKSLAATGFFLGGYLLAWIAFSFAATLGQWALESALLLTPMMTSASRIFSGVLLVAVGLFQWTPLKDVCLKQC